MDDPNAPVGSGRFVSRRGARFGALGVVAIAVFVALGTYSLAGDGVTYYETPSELTVGEDHGERVVRLGGLVVEGSIEQDGEAVRFVLTDGVADVEVYHAGEIRGVFQEGQGALVEGRARADGSFASHTVMVQHDNVYEAEGGGDEATGDYGASP